MVEAWYLEPHCSGLAFGPIGFNNLHSYSLKKQDKEQHVYLRCRRIRWDRADTASRGVLEVVGVLTQVICLFSNLSIKQRDSTGIKVKYRDSGSFFNHAVNPAQYQAWPNSLSSTRTHFWAQSQEQPLNVTKFGPISLPPPNLCCWYAVILCWSDPLLYFTQNLYAGQTWHCSQLHKICTIFQKISVHTS